MTPYHVQYIEYAASASQGVVQQWLQCTHTAKIILT